MKTLRYILSTTHRTLLLLMSLIAGGNAIWAQGFTPAANIDKVNTTYKTVIYDPTTQQMTLHLFENAPEVSGDCDATPDYMQSHGYARWYLVEVANDDTPIEEGTLITGAELTTTENGAYTAIYTAMTEPGYGWYVYKFNKISGTNVFVKLDYNWRFERYTPTITLPAEYATEANWRKVRVVCVVTSKDGGFSDWGTADPELQWKYVYRLCTVDELRGFRPFVHYRGEAYSYLSKLNPDDPNFVTGASTFIEERKNAYDYTTVGTAASQYSWEEGTVQTTQNIRQTVHTYDYYYYLNLEPGQTEKLILPYAAYGPQAARQEARTYVRWYDYATDKASPYIQPTGNVTQTYLEDWSYDATSSYGLIGPFKNGKISPGVHPTYEPSYSGRNINGAATTYYQTSGKELGVNFVAPDDFQSRTEEIVVTLDISRYIDGMDESFQYIVHEPTLSTRFHFHILPAHVIADKARSLAPSLTAVATQLAEKKPTELPSILEYNGRTVISWNNANSSKFMLRTQQEQLQHYYFYDTDGTTIRAAKYLKMYALRKDNNDKWWKKEVGWANARMSQYTKAMFTVGTWQNVNDPSETEPVTDGSGITHVYAVGCVGDDAYGGAATEQPIMLTELEFTEMTPLAIGAATETDETSTRSRAYMMQNYTLAAKVDFDDVFVVGTTKPNTALENFAKIPLMPADAAYGFCYPQLYGLCGTGRYPVTGGEGFGYQPQNGISPMHSDYLIAKSANVNIISKSGSVSSSNQNIITNPFTSLFCLWHGEKKELYDVTHEREDGKELTSKNNYGGFLYTDASDEARTIVTMELDASFCHNARVYYTAYISDMNGTETNAKPIMRVRMSTYNTTTGRPDGQSLDGSPLKLLPVVSFEACILNTLVGPLNSGNPTKENTWFQLYGETSIPSEFEYLLNGSSRHYYVDIDNYCDNSMGADYCVDDIRFYTQTTPIIAEINQDPCADRTEVKLVTDANILLDELKDISTERYKTVFYRIYERHDDNRPIQDGEEVTGVGIYTTNKQGTSSNLYGSVVIDTEFDLTTATSTLSGGVIYNTAGTAITSNSNSGFFKDAKGNVNFQFFDNMFDLKPGQKYFISFYNFAYDKVNGPNEWGNPYTDPCSSFSNDFVPNRVYLEMYENGSDAPSDGSISFDCGEASKYIKFDIKVKYPLTDGTYKTFDDIMFDFFVTSQLTGENINAKQEFNAIFKVIAGETIYLSEALEHLRAEYYPSDPSEKYDEYENASDLPAPKGVFTANDKTLIEEWMGHDVAEGKLMLNAATQFAYTFTPDNDLYFAGMPINKKVEGSYDICSPLDLFFKIVKDFNAPQMTLGFDDVDYPEGYEQVVRVGLEQLTKMIKDEDNYKLHIPVKSYVNKNTSGKKLYFEGNTDFILMDTNDPLAVGYITKTIAKIVSPEEDNAKPYVNDSHMYLSLDLSKRQAGFEFREGYWYKVSTQFYDEDDEGAGTNKCIGDVTFIFKVVPEFVTWEPSVIHTDIYSANWYDDGNWQRSVRSELYKGEVTDNTTPYNHATGGHPNGYKDNSEMGISGNLAYVPMKFTYVTIPTLKHAPSLIDEPIIEGSEWTGGNLIDPNVSTTGTQMLTDTSPVVTNLSSSPTPNIRYDMLVRYGTYDEGGEGCHGHRCLTGGTWGNHPEGSHGAQKPTAKVYDVEKFHGNICKEIYFKPGAELLKQNRLIYKKAWVEKELVANKWYLMSTPLRETYAGDMYVPVSDTPADNGRQTTEAFHDINFSTTGDAAGVKYSRTQYPIYQHSWGEDAKVLTKTDDVRATQYAAELDFDNVTEELAEWGHTYNDVEVPYNKYTGFAIRAHRKPQKDASDNDVPALLRLPKHDTSYKYYQWDNTEGDTPSGDVSDKSPEDVNSPYAKLTFDSTTATDDDKKRIEWNLDDLQQQTMDGYTYYLVGNPFVSAIDMGKFFSYINTSGQRIDVNGNFSMVYYTYDANVLKTIDARVEPTAELPHIIKPLQAFFVKCKTDSKPDKVIFNTDMMVDGNYDGALGSATRAGLGPNNAPPIWLTASNGNGTSMASLLIGLGHLSEFDRSEDATALFDSHLADVPVVFTMAGQQAVSIDARPSLDLVPFGVACGTQNEAVDLKITDFAPLTPALYVLDAVTGTKTEVHDGQPLKVQPNDYGRYFLTTHGDVTTVDNVDGGGIVISVRDRQVTVHATSNLKLARVLTTGGITVNSMSDCGTDAVFNLTLGGIYVVEAVTEEGRQTMTVVVR